MLKAVEDAFTIVHIRISSIRILGVCARHFITGALVVFIIFNTIRIFNTIKDANYLGFIESGIFIVVTLYFCLAWVTSWPKAGKMLNRAGEYEKKYDHD